MENTDSVENILVKLIQGVDPKSGDFISESSPLSQVSVKQALNTALDAVKSYHSQHVKKMNFPANTGKPWKKEDDEKLALDFDQGISIEDSAKSFQRTNGSIRARLIKLGKIEDDGVWSGLAKQI